MAFCLDPFMQLMCDCSDDLEGHHINSPCYQIQVMCRERPSRERPRSPSQRHEDGELTDDAHRRDPEAGAKQRTSSKTDRQGVVASREGDRSKSKERHWSKSQERRRSLSRERRKRSPHRDRRRSKSRDRNRKSKSPERRRRRSVSREDGTAALASNKQTERGGEVEGNGTANGHAEKKTPPAQVTLPPFPLPQSH